MARNEGEARDRVKGEGRGGSRRVKGRLTVTNETKKMLVLKGKK